MLKLLSSLLSVIAKALGLWHDHKLEQQGRQEEDAKIREAVDANVAKAENAVSTSDPERDERLRNQFDRSRRK